LAPIDWKQHDSDATTQPTTSTAHPMHANQPQSDAYSTQQCNTATE